MMPGAITWLVTGTIQSAIVPASIASSTGRQETCTFDRCASRYAVSFQMGRAMNQTTSSSIRKRPSSLKNMWYTSSAMPKKTTSR